MAASQDECVAQFPRQMVCVDRSYARMAAWAAYTIALPLPPTSTAPEIANVQQRILAERTPMQGTTYAQQVTPYLVEIPNITNKIRDHLNAWNAESTETTLAADIDGAFATVMPQFAAMIITDYDVALWCDKHDYPRPPGLSGTLPPPPTA
jgi:hypothetical protein